MDLRFMMAKSIRFESEVNSTIRRHLLFASLHFQMFCLQILQFHAVDYKIDVFLLDFEENIAKQ